MKQQTISVGFIFSAVKKLTVSHFLLLILNLLIALTLSGCAVDGGGGGGEENQNPPSTGWIWISGSSSANQQGVYGTKEQSDADNIPGARKGAISWKDSADNLWLFGGLGFDSTGDSKGFLNDLWKYDGTDWTWVSGSELTYAFGIYDSTDDAVNVPGARCDSISWIDSLGNLWLFGGRGCEAGQVDQGRCLNSQLNDLWKYDGTYWKWISGSKMADATGDYGTKGDDSSENVPGARDNSISWIDSSDNLWLFGGATGCNGDVCSNGHFLNDLWKFDGTNWTWVSGSDSIRQTGTYGTKGVSDSDNVPGARKSGISWIDSQGNFWLFGGNGYDSTGVIGYLNDLWRFDGYNWTWISGSDTRKQSGIYGTKGDATADNVPGARIESISWIDSQVNFWLFGGNGYDSSTGDRGYLNDLWKFDGSQWTWVAGSNIRNQTADYGTQGVADPENDPGARSLSVSWIDSDDQHWLFGGESGTDSLNDLWMYEH